MLILTIEMEYDCPAFQDEEKTDSTTAEQDSGEKKVRPVYPYKGKIKSVTVKPVPQPQLKLEDAIEAPTPAPIPIKREHIYVSPVIVKPLSTTSLSKEEINNYISMLKYGETIDNKENAARALGSFGVKTYISTNDPIVNDIYNALINAFRENNDENLLKSIASSLGELGKEEAGNVLVNYLLNGNNSSVKSYVIHSLGRLKYKASVFQLIHILRNDTNPELRAQSANALGMIKDSSAVYPLISTLNDYDHSVKKAAIIALGDMGVQEAEYQLKQILDYDKNLELREAAAGALRKIESASDSHR